MTDDRGQQGVLLATRPSGGTAEMAWAGDWRQMLMQVIRQFPTTKHTALLTSFVDPRGAGIALLAGTCRTASMLCLGCPNGAVALTLGCRFARVDICDLPTDNVEVLRRVAARAGMTHVVFSSFSHQGSLPYLAKQFDVVYVNTDLFGRLAIREPEAMDFWEEVSRVLKPSGHCVAVASNRWSFRRYFARRADARPHEALYTPASLRRALQNAGMTASALYGLLPDHQSPSSIFDLNSRDADRSEAFSRAFSSTIKTRCFHNKLLVPSFALIGKRSDSSLAKTQAIHNVPVPFIIELLRTVEERLTQEGRVGPTLVIRRVIVRRTGRLVIFAGRQAHADAEVLIKVPYDPWAEARDRRNAQTLRLLHENGAIPQWIRSLVPRSFVCDDFMEQAYFVEEMKPGVTSYPSAWKLTQRLFPSRGRIPVPHEIILAQVAKALLELQMATARRVPYNEKRFDSLRQALSVLRQLTEDEDLLPLYERIEAYLEKGLLGREIPSVWSHGDIGLLNVLRDRQGQLTGIIDWESFQTEGLPLCDSVMLAVSPRGGDVRDWRRLASVMHRPYDLVPADYLERLNLSSDLVAPLAIATWVQYVAYRGPRKRFDRGWIETNIFRVLELLGSSL